MNISWGIAAAAVVVAAIATLAGCNGSGAAAGDNAGRATAVDLTTAVAANTLAYIPAQCFTRTRDNAASPAQNPCYVCHADSREPNYGGDSALQKAYSFPQVEAGHQVVNPWTNLFKDRRAAIAAISDDEIRRYVGQDNYLDPAGRIILAQKIAHLPPAWDARRDGHWSGYVPDAYFHFDARGFDRAPDGRATGWRAFAYYPFPGAFMPTNGAFDDVLIRLPAAFRETEAGVEDLDLYAVNLAIVESIIKRADVPIPKTDETRLGVDLDHDGRLTTATRVVYHWNPLAHDTMQYVGRAKQELAAGTVHLAAGLFPEGTEFLHSVRYLGVGPDGTVVPGKRMKELRYGRKAYWRSYADLDLLAKREAKEKALNRDQVDLFGGNSESGLANNLGWLYQGFIEDRNGDLRPQSYEETLFCMGCHTTVSPTVDGAFALPRKLVSGDRQGWYHWSDPSRGALPDPVRRDGRLEYTTYLENNGAGDEFRANDEVRAKFFNADGDRKTAMFKALARDVNVLLIPTAERALLLDKAYRTLVVEQTFALGRDATPEPAANVLREVEQDKPTGVRIAQPAPGLALP